MFEHVVTLSNNISWHILSRRYTPYDIYIYIYFIIYLYVHIYLLIEDAMQRDTDASSIFGLGVFVIRLGMWRSAAYSFG